MPYLKHVKAISKGWPHVKYLADWMEVSTSPVKWKFIKDAPSNIEMRVNRTQVAMLDFFTNGQSTRKDFNTIGELSSLFKDPTFSHNPSHARLFVVEDLSRDMIETFGAQFDIDPLFFRGQISDYLWYNTKDPWVELGDLAHIVSERNYYNFRYMSGRYFEDQNSFDRGTEQCGTFNVLRRLDHDRGSFVLQDPKNAAVALVRSKASLWIRENRVGQGVLGEFLILHCKVVTIFNYSLGILIVDPTVKEGSPLWGGYRNFCPCPSMLGPIPQGPPRTSLFEDVIHYHMAMSKQDILRLSTQPNEFGFAILNIVGAEWLSVLKYLTTRLTQIEWELEHPDFRTPPYGLDGSLRRLHPWRRGIPVYRAMVNEVLRTILGESDAASTFGTHLARLRSDFQIILAEIDMLDKRIESMVNVATAIISLEENKRAMKQNHNLSRLTYLAVIFVPMSFVSSLFSMTTDLSLLTRTFWIYFAVALPITILALGVADWLHVKSKLRWVGTKMNKVVRKQDYDLR